MLLELLRSFATNGPLVFFEVEGQGPGAVLNVDNAQDTIAVSVRAVCLYPMDRVEIIAYFQNQLRRRYGLVVRGEHCEELVP